MGVRRGCYAGGPGVGHLLGAAGGGGWCLSHFLLREGSDLAILDRVLKAENITLTAQLRNPHSLLKNKLD